MPQTELVQAMHDPNFFSRTGAAVDFIQTHISCLFLTAEDVYKLKKPVNLGFLDFSTLEKRHFYCQEEVRLNSRLAPSVYLGVVPVSKDQTGRFLLGDHPGAEIVDYLVHMRRLSEENMFPALLDQGRVDPDLIQELASLLAGFHAQARVVAAGSDLGSPQLVWANIEENFEQIRPMVPTAISETRHRVMRQAMLWTLTRQHDLLAFRHSHGMTRECHGDLRMEHLCLFEGRLVVFDCIEFNERFRFIDTAADLAFLLMDMEFHGFWELVQSLVNAYEQAANDQEMLPILNLYKAYYALTRGKVLGIKSLENDFNPQEQGQALHEAAQFFDLAWSYAVKLQDPAVIVVCGLMGTGKSTVSRWIGEQLGADVLHSDVVRKIIHGLDPHTHRYEGYGQGLYSAQASRVTYAELCARAEENILQQRAVIVDASFSRREDRAHILDMARKHGVRCVFVECVCPGEVVTHRLDRRQDQGKDVSDGRRDLLATQKHHFQPLTDMDPSMHAVVETAGEREHVLESALETVLTALRRQEELTVKSSSYPS